MRSRNQLIEEVCIRSAQSVANAVAFGHGHLARQETEHFGYKPLRYRLANRAVVGIAEIVSSAERVRQIAKLSWISARLGATSLSLL